MADETGTLALVRAVRAGDFDTARRLLAGGVPVPRGAVGSAAELLRANEMALALEFGATVADETGDWRPPVALVLETYARDPKGKHAILEMFATHGVPLPDTPPMAAHRGRTDLLEEHLRRDPGMLTGAFGHREIWPLELGCHADEDLALCGAPLAGATLLHLCAEYEDLDTARWLLDHGMDANVRAAVDGDGFGGHTALFNCIVTYNAGRRDDSMARLLLERGADPSIRASIRKRLAFARDTGTHEYRDVTALEWGERFHDQSYVSEPNIRLLR
jgi:hypothetical protein